MAGKLSTESYKGVRDFYPRDMFLENYILDVMRSVPERFGYVEYGASILEPAELYRTKTSEEIVGEQMYTFTDRGKRDVALRPEMTPTLARMVAAKRRELNFPLRWYSIPNLFRYERPQRGRLREHWQLNVDLFGVESLEADVEIVSIACAILEAFGLADGQFTIRLNDRRILNIILNDELGLSEEKADAIRRLIDRRAKIDDFPTEASALIGVKKARELERLLEGEGGLETLKETHPAVAEFLSLLGRLDECGVKNALYDPNIVRGFDYYTGTVFEVFDTSPNNNRSLFGGGRYDNLLELFGGETVPAVGFGMGDVSMRDVLETYKLTPAYRPKTDLFLATLEAAFIPHAEKLARELRKEGVNVAVNLTEKKVGDQIKKADRDGVPFVIVIGDSEVAGATYTLKELASGEETTVDRRTIAQKLKQPR